MIIIHQPGFPWNKGISLPQLPFEVRSCEVAIIWPEINQRHKSGQIAIIPKAKLIKGILVGSALYFSPPLGDKCSPQITTFGPPTKTVNHEGFKP